MDLKNLNTFIQVAEMSSFTKAAKTLGYSQSTVSFQIRQLEEEWEIQLFERISHNISLTEKVCPWGKTDDSGDGSSYPLRHKGGRPYSACNGRFAVKAAFVGRF